MEYFEKWIKYLKLKKNKMAEIQDGSYTYGGIQTYGGCPNMRGIQTYRGHPNVWYGHSLSGTKHAFFVLCMYGGHPNIIQTYRKCPNIQTYKGGASKHMGAFQHTGGHSNIWGYLNLWGHPNVWSIWTPP